MAGNNTTYRLNFKVGADASEAIAQINKLNATLNNIQSKPVSIFNPNEFKDAVSAAEDVQKALQHAIDPRSGQFDLSRFSLSIQQSGKSLTQLRDQFVAMGDEGEEAFLQLSTVIANAEKPTSRLVALTKRLRNTFINTINWNITNGAIRAITGTLKSAMGYAEDLNKSLNNIRIVTGKSADDMARFAKAATEAAKGLSSTTKEYTDATLIYYRQGLSDEEVKERADVTIKMANVTSESAQQVSEHLTAVWNNFDDGTKSLEYYADVMTKLGATTASSTTEISEGLEKFAAIADTVGLSYEYAASALATVTATTRQSADIVGTAFKTLFARMESLKLGETLEDGTDLKQYSQALATVGVNIKDANGELRAMDDILDDLGAKWSMISNDQQVALAQQIAGVRQYTQLMALMNNWDFMQQNLATANSSEGILAQQQAIYAQSWEASADRVRAAWEDLYNFIADDDFFIGLNDLLSGTLIPGLEGFIKGLGGIKGLLTTIFGNILSRAAKEVPNFLQTVITEVKILIGLGAKEAQRVQGENAGLSRDLAKSFFKKGKYKETGQAIGNAEVSTVKSTSGLSGGEYQDYLYAANTIRKVRTKEGQSLDDTNVQIEKLQKQQEEAIDKLKQSQIKKNEQLLAQQQKALNKTQEKQKKEQETLAHIEQEKNSLDINNKKYEEKLVKLDEEEKQSKKRLEDLNNEEELLQVQLKTTTNLVNTQKEAVNKVKQGLNEQQQQNYDIANARWRGVNVVRGYASQMQEVSKPGVLEGMDPKQLGLLATNLMQNLQPNLQFLTKGTDAASLAVKNKLQKQMKAIENAVSRDEKSEDYNEQIKKAIKEFSDYISNPKGPVAKVINKNIKDAEQEFDKAAENVDSKAHQIVKETGQKIAEHGSNPLDPIEMEQDANEPILNPQHTKETIEHMSELVGVGMQLSGVFQSTSSAMEVFGDKNATLSEQVGALASSSLTLVMAIGSLNKIIEESNLIADLALTKKLKEILTSKLTTATVTAEAAAKKTATLVNLAYAAAAVAVVAAVGAVAYSIQKSRKATVEQAKAANELTKTTYEEGQKVRELSEQYRDLYQQKQSGIDVSVDLKKTALELADALENEELRALALTGQYERLAQAIKEANDKSAENAYNEAQIAVSKNKQALREQLTYGVRGGNLRVENDQATFNYSGSRSTVGLELDTVQLLQDKGLLDESGHLGFSVSGKDEIEVAAKIVEKQEEFNTKLQEVIKQLDGREKNIVDEILRDFSKDFDKGSGDSNFAEVYQGTTANNEILQTSYLRTKEGQAKLSTIKDAKSAQEVLDYLENEIGHSDKWATRIAEAMPEIANTVLSAQRIQTGFDLENAEQVDKVLDIFGDNLIHASEDFVKTFIDNDQLLQEELERAVHAAERAQLVLDQEAFQKGSNVIGDFNKEEQWATTNENLLAQYANVTKEQFLFGMSEEQKQQLFSDILQSISGALLDANNQYLEDLEQREKTLLEAYQKSKRETGDSKETNDLKELADNEQAVIDSIQESNASEVLNIINKEIERQANLYGLNADEVKNLTEQLAKQNPQLKNNRQEAAQVAVSISRLDKGVKALNKDYQDQITYLRQGNTWSKEYRDAVTVLSKDLADVFNIDDYSVFTDEFILLNQDRIQAISDGNMEIADAFSATVAQFLLDSALANGQITQETYDTLQFLISKVDEINALPVGSKLPDTWAANMTGMINVTAEAARVMEDILGSINITSTISTNPDGTVNFSTRTAGPRSITAPKVKSSGGGGGKSKKAKAKYDGTQYERYKEITDKIDDVSRAMKEMEAVSDSLYGASKLDAMQKEIDLLDKQATNYRKKRKEAEEYLELDKARMIAYAEANGLSLKVEGNRVVNYREIMDSLQAQIDSHTAKYNSLGTEEAQSEYNEKYIQPIVDKMDGLQKVIDKFDETYDVVEDNWEEEKAIRRQQQDMQYELIQGKYSMQMKLVENDLKYLETIGQLIGDDIYEAVEKALLTWNPNSKENQAQVTMEQLHILQEKSNELNRKFALWEEDPLTKEGINRDKYIAGQQEVFEGMLELATTLDEIDKNMAHLVRETISKWNEEWDYWLARQNRNTEVLQYIERLIPVIYGKNNYRAMQQWYDTNLAQSERLYETAKENHKVAVENLKRIQQDYDNATLEEQAFLRDSLRAAQEQADKTAKEEEDAHLAALEAKSQQIQNHISAAWQTFEEEITNGLGFDFLKTSFGNLSSTMDLLYTKTEQVYEVNKFLHELSKDMDKTDSIAAKNKIKNFAKETEAMKEQGELTKFELEVQKAKYNILLAQIALEDAQNAKSIVRLHRDDEGNYGYVYSADPNKLDDAQQKLEDKQHDLYELVKNGTNQFAQAMANETQQFMQQVQKLQDIYGKNTAKYFEELAILQEEHDHKMTVLRTNYQLAITELDVAGIEGRKEAYVTEHEDEINSLLNWKETERATIETVNEDLAELTDYTRDSVVGAIGSVDQALKDTNASAEELTNYMTNELKNAMKENLTGISEQVLGYKNWRTELLGVKNDALDAAKALKELIEIETWKKNNTNPSEKETIGTEMAPGGITNSPLGGGPSQNDSGDQSLFVPATPPTPPQEKTLADYFTKAQLALFDTYIGGRQSSMSKQDLNNLVNALKLVPKLFKYKGTSYNRASIISTLQSYIDKRFPKQDTSLSRNNNNIAMAYATGGYTGNFGPEGRLAVLHEKELVLNKEDTENMLAAVGIIRKVTSAIDLKALSSLSSLGALGTPSYSTQDQVLQQTVTISAQFPNATNHSEIEEAFNNLINRASQYAARR